jgi:hypothetical protein
VTTPKAARAPLFCLGRSIGAVAGMLFGIGAARFGYALARFRTTISTMVCGRNVKVRVLALEFDATM